MSDELEQEYNEAILEISEEDQNRAPKEKDVTPKSSEEKPPETATKQVMVSINKSGVMGFKNQVELSQAAQLVMRLKIAPDHLRKEGLEAVMAALTLCRQLNLPVTALNEMGYIKGKVTCYGSLTTALCEKHPQYGDQEIFWINAAQDIICLKNKNLNDPVWACVIQSKKKNSEKWIEFVFSVDDAKTAGLLTETTKPDSAWRKYVKDMVFHKAKNRMQRAQYASALVGVIHHEAMLYDEKVLSEPREVGPGINEELGLRKEQGEIRGA